MPRERTCGEAMFQRVANQSWWGERNQASPHVARRDDAELSTQPTARPSIVGHRHNRCELITLVDQGFEHGGEAVATTDGDDGGPGHFSTSR